MKVALYARVSMAKDEGENKAQHPETQLIQLRKVAKEEGYEVYQEYVDRQSGKDLKRPALEQMVRDARGNRFSLILTTKVDRLSRSLLDLLSILQEFSAMRIPVKVRFIEDESASTDTPHGELVLQMLGSFAQFERKMMAARTKAGIERYRKTNNAWGRRPVCTMEEVMELRNQGLSIRKIAKKLDVANATVLKYMRCSKNATQNSISNSTEEKGT